MKRYLLLLLVALLPMVANAYDAKIDGIYYNFSGNEATVTFYQHSDYSGSVVIPTSVTYNGKIYKVTNIGKKAFSYCSNLTSITIPSSVTSIGEDAFYHCSNLTSITIPSSVTSIREYAFYDCNSLTAVHISDISAWCGITFIGNSSNPLWYAKHLYMNSEEIKDLIIPEGVTHIDDRFKSCIGLTSVTIPNSVTNLGNNAFSNCIGLTSVNIGNSVTTIGDIAFSGCSSLASVNIGNSVTTIGDIAFSGCSSLASITIPNSVTSIGKSVFSSCI